MTTYTGNSGVVRIDSNNIGEVVSFDINEAADRVEDTALGDTNRTYKAGLQDVSGTITCHWDPGDTTGQDLMTPGASVNLVLWPQGAGTGNEEWTVTATILSVQTSVTFNEIIEAVFEWAAAGALTKGVQS